MNIVTFTKEIFRGKTIGRILLNDQIAISCKSITGKVIDVAGGDQPSYRRFLPEGIDIVSTDIVRDGKQASIIVDFNKPLPYKDEQFDSGLFFNALYIAENQHYTLKEINRVLRKGGVLYLSSPLLLGEIPEPVDYCRLTQQGLEGKLSRAGFSEIKIIRVGERFTSVANLLHPFLFFNFIRFFVYGFCLVLDKIFSRILKKFGPAPIGYFCVAMK